MSSKKIGKSLKQYKSIFKRVPTASSVSPSSRSASPNKTPSDSSTQLPTSSSESESDIDERTDLEKELFELVENGDTNAVQNFLQNNRTIDVNKRNTEGCSVLHKAVINEDAGMVEVLLAEDLDTDINDSLLHAIKENSMQMVLKLLKHKDSVKSRKSIIKKLFPKTNIEFDSTINGEDITPLLMAAMSGHYEIVELLYTRGERLGELHFPSCDCSVCGKSSRDLRKSNNRIHLLRGLANPTYIAFIAGVDKNLDPIQKVFQITRDIKTCMKEEPEFRDEYEEILNEIKPFPVDMLSLCRNTNEARIFLRKKSGYTGSSTLPFPRLLLAMDLNQKEFVAHPHAQDILNQEWIGEPWTTTNFSEALFKNIVIVILIAFYPLISIVLWFTLCCCQRFQWIRFITSPINRFKSSMASYTIFLVVLWYIDTSEKGPADLGPPSFYLPWIVGVFVLSHMISFLSHFLINPKYFVDSWNMFDLVTQFFFKATITLWILQWKTKRGVNDSAVGKVQHHTIKRNELEPYDITILAEITLGIASTMAALKPLRAFMLNPTLGPLQIALGKMCQDVVQFAVYFAFILFSFSLSTQHLYRPYSSFTDTEGKIVNENKRLSKFFPALEAFFWAMFTMTDANSPALEPIPVNQLVTNHHFLTQSVGKIIFVAFHVLTVTFLLNTLTGVMSNTYGRIVDNVNAEWKHARSRIWVYYIQDSIVTAPFNIIPNGLFILNICAWLRLLTGTKESNRRATCTLTNCCRLEAVETDRERKEREHEYPILIRRLLQRYFRSKDSTASEDPPAKDDVTNVHNNIFELKGMTKLSLEKEPNTQNSTHTNPTGSTAGSPRNASTKALTQTRTNTTPSKVISTNNIGSTSQTQQIQMNSPASSSTAQLSRHVGFPPGGGSGSNINI